MANHSYEMVIAGAGIAGLTAAYVARKQGLSTAVVTTGAGRYIYGAGWFSAQEKEGLDADLLEKATEAFHEFSDAADCEFAGNLRQNLALPNVLGDFQAVTMASQTLWNGAASEVARIAVVGIEGLAGFDENFLADRLNGNAQRAGISCSYTAHQISLVECNAMPLTPTRVANSFDADPAFRVQLAKELRRIAGNCDRILLPSVLGLHSSSQQISAFIAGVGTNVGELATLPPSIAAVRVQNRLERELQKMGVELYRGFPIRNLMIEGQLCTGLVIDAPGRGTTIHAERMLLTAGSANARLLGKTGYGLDALLRPSSAEGEPLAWNLMVAESQASTHTGSLARLCAGYRAASLLRAAKESYAA